MKGTATEYGTEVKFIYNGTNQPNYVAENNASGKVSYIHNTFYYYNGTEIVKIDPTKGVSGTEIIRLKNNDYIYDINLNKGTKAYTMLFEDGGYYFSFCVFFFVF